MEPAITALRNKFNKPKNHLENIYRFHQTRQKKNELCDSFLQKLKAEGRPCDFLQDG